MLRRTSPRDRPDEDLCRTLGQRTRCGQASNRPTIQTCLGNPAQIRDAEGIARHRSQWLRWEALFCSWWG